MSSISPSVDGVAALVEARWSHARWVGSRDVVTSMGKIECPTLAVSRTRGGVLIPRGGARVVGAALEDGVVTLTILEVSP